VLWRPGTFSGAELWVGAPGKSLIGSRNDEVHQIDEREESMKGAVIGNGLIALAGMVAVFGSGALAQTPPVAPTGSAVLAFGVLVGRWARTEGPYVINIIAVDENGKLDASYANPRPLPFHTAEVTRDGNALKLFFELRAAGYGGSTYTLKYDAASDSLRGVYDQVVVMQKFDVVFNRTK
jgi:hypothetical protein